MTTRSETRIPHVTAGTTRETTTGVERGRDVDVTVVLPDGGVVEGEVTLLPAEDGRAVYERWGDPANWVDGRLLRALRAAYPDHGEFRAALGELDAVAGGAAGRP